jgi:hypothetical protein
MAAVFACGDRLVVSVGLPQGGADVAKRLAPALPLAAQSAGYRLPPDVP